jgi:hypothetical protein
MKQVLFISLMAIFSSVDLTYGDDHEAVEKVIKAFSKAGDERNVAKIEQLTSADYRIVMNQLFGSNEISTMDRATYILMIETKKFGGDERTVKVNSIIISGYNAVADVVLSGKEMNLRSIFTLCKDNEGKWVLLSDTPTVLP